MYKELVLTKLSEVAADIIIKVYANNNTAKMFSLGITAESRWLGECTVLP